MISDVQADLYSFWQQFDLPVYWQGNVDTDAELPYLVINAESTDILENVLLYATIYVESKDFTLRRNTLDSIALAIPYQGAKLDSIVLYRNTNFQTLGTEDDDVYYGRTAYIARGYKE